MGDTRPRCSICRSDLSASSGSRQPDGELRFRRLDGRLLPEVPPPLEVLGDPVKILHTQHDAEGLVLHARTTTPGWLGERLDVGWAIDVLHPLAR